MNIEISPDIDNEQANIECAEPLEPAVNCGFCRKRRANGMLCDTRPGPGRPEYVPVCAHCHGKALDGKKLRWPVVTDRTVFRRVTEVLPGGYK